MGKILLGFVVISILVVAYQLYIASTKRNSSEMD